MFAADITSAVQEHECRRLAAFARLQRLVLEVGSEFGRSTIALAATAAVVHAVDWHCGDAASGWKDSLAAFLANLERYGVRDRVVVHLGSSELVLPVLQAGAFDGAFIDGDHSEEAVVHDLHQVAQLVKPGGWILLHDGDQAQVRAVAERFAVAYGQRLLPPRAGTLLELVAPATVINARVVR